MVSFGCLKPLALIVAFPCLNKQYWDYSHCGKWDGLHPSSPERESQSWLCWVGSWQPEPLTSWQLPAMIPQGERAHWGHREELKQTEASLQQMLHLKPTLPSLRWGTCSQVCRGGQPRTPLLPEKEAGSWGPGIFPTHADKYQAGSLARARLGYQDTQLSLRLSPALCYSLSIMCSVNPKQMDESCHTKSQRQCLEAWTSSSSSLETSKFWVFGRNTLTVANYWSPDICCCMANVKAVSTWENRDRGQANVTIVVRIGIFLG